MLLLLNFLLLIAMISTILMMLTLLVSKKSIMDREKSSPFECGFNPKSSARLPFSLRFFLIAIIFLIFDIEIAILLPIFVTFHFSNLSSWLFIISFFIIVLILGLYYEWYQGALNWSK